MKQLLFVLICLWILPKAFSQVPQQFNYQAVVRNAAGNPLTNQAVGILIRIHDQVTNGTVLYSETHHGTTNAFGLITLSIGNGTINTGSWSAINWAVNSKFIEVEIDVAGGSNYVSMGTTQLLSVPYALYAASTSMNLDDLNDVNCPTPTNGQVLQWNGTTWIPGTISNPGDNWGSQVAVTDTSILGDGTSSNPLTVNQNNKINLSQLKSGSAANGQYLKWNGSAWVPGTVSITGDNWGTQNVVTNSTLLGNGTSASPLAFNPATSINPNQISSAGATNGQLLGWNGTSWIPYSIGAGINTWGLTGNSGTNPTTNYIGTADNNPVIIKSNNVQNAKFDQATKQVLIGELAGNNSTGFSNVAIGSKALFMNSNKGNLIAIGDSTLMNNSTGATFGYEGVLNTAIGSKAMIQNTKGSYNVSIGPNTLHNNLSGMANVAIGRNSLYSNDADNNTGIGFGALYYNTSGSENIGIGHSALYFNNTGYSNTAIGTGALSYNTTGYENTAIGEAALYANTIGRNNTAIGYEADVTYSALVNATAIGHGAKVTDSNMVMLGDTSVVDWGFGASPANGRCFQVGHNATNGNGAYLTDGGVWTDISNAELKDNVTTLNGDDILKKITQMPISKWKYKGTANEFHIGPMAQDFQKLFNLGDGRSISAMDKSGIALIGIQELSKENEILKNKIDAQEKLIEQLKNRLEKIELQANKN